MPIIDIEGRVLKSGIENMVTSIRPSSFGAIFQSVPFIPSAETASAISQMGYCPSLVSVGSKDAHRTAAELLRLNDGSLAARGILHSTRPFQTNPTSNNESSEQRTSRILETVLTPYEAMSTSGYLILYGVRSYSIPPDLMRCFSINATAASIDKKKGPWEDRRNEMISFLAPYYRHAEGRLPIPLDTALEAARAIRDLLPETMSIPFSDGQKNLFFGDALEYNGKTGKDERPPASTEERIVDSLMDRLALYNYMHGELQRGRDMGEFAVARDGDLTPKNTLVPNAGLLISSLTQARIQGIRRVLQRLGISPDELKLSLDILRAPCEFCGHSLAGGMSYGLNGGGLLEPRMSRIVRERIKDGSRRIKIVLAGTLFDEVKDAAMMLELSLRKQFRSEGAGDLTFESWLSDWDVAIVGYSIEATFLSDIKKGLSQSAVPEFFKKRIRLEFIDLVDAGQWERIHAERPDIVSTSCSLYVSESFSDWESHADPNLAMSLWYSDFIMQLLPRGGLFIVEPGYRVIPHPADVNPLYHKKTDSFFSGVFEKMPEG